MSSSSGISGLTTISVDRPPGGPDFIDPALIDRIAQQAATITQERLREEFQNQKMAAVKRTGNIIVRSTGIGAGVGALAGGIIACMTKKDSKDGAQKGALIGGGIGMYLGKSLAEAAETK